MYEGSNMIFKFNLNWKISVLHPKQIPEPQISGACVSAFAVLVLFHRDHSDATIPFAFPTIREASDHQCSWSPQEGVQVPLHAQEQLLNSSSWVDLVPNFRQEIRQSHYRNDPVKYDFAGGWLILTMIRRGQCAVFEWFKEKKKTIIHFVLMNLTLVLRLGGISFTNY